MYGVNYCKSYLETTVKGLGYDQSHLKLITKMRKVTENRILKYLANIIFCLKLIKKWMFS